MRHQSYYPARGIGPRPSGFGRISRWRWRWRWRWTR
jgi:hypothetical protein